MAKRNGAIKLEGAASNGENKTVKFGAITINEDFNVRKVYPKKTLEELAETIRLAGGILNPLIVSELPDGKYFLLGGFRRSRALKMIYGDQVEDVDVPVRVIKYTNDEDGQIANLMADGPQEPVKKYDLADRLTYLRQEKNLENKVLAARTGLGHMTVSQLITCRTKLHPDIIEAWKAAPTPEQEIKFTHLLDWARLPKDEQLLPFKKYMEDRAGDEGEDGDGDGKKKRKKSKAENAATEKIRPKKQISTQLQKFEEKKEELEGEKLGAYRALRWALSYTEKLALSSG